MLHILYLMWPYRVSRIFLSSKWFIRNITHLHFFLCIYIHCPCHTNQKTKSLTKCAQPENKGKGQMAMTNSETLPEKPLLSSLIVTLSLLCNRTRKAWTVKLLIKKAASRGDVILLCKSQNKHNGSSEKSGTRWENKMFFFSTPNYSSSPYIFPWLDPQGKTINSSLFPSMPQF